METPETIRTSLQTGEWVTSKDFKDAYFHIPIHNQSRKYMRFHVQGRFYQFKALPFGLSTAPLEFTVVAKEVKLTALQKGIRIHQYLDDWLVRATSHQTCLQHTQTLVALYRELSWLVNKEKSELDSKQVFNFVGYQFDLAEGKVRPTPEHWQALTDKIQSILSGLVCPVPQFMSLITFLIATEKQVHLGRLHMRSIQWHLKNNWRGLLFCWPWVLANAGVRSMRGYIRTSDTSQTGLRCLCTPHPAFYPRTSWLRRVQIVSSQWSYQPWPPHWISHSGDRSLCPIRVLRYYLDRTSDLRQNKELVFVSSKILTRTSHLSPLPHGSSRL